MGCTIMGNAKAKSGKSESGADVRAIDVHGHYGRSIDQPCALANRFMSASPAEVVRRARAGNIEWTLVSPLAGLMIKAHHDTARANRDAFRRVPGQPGLLQWFVLNPFCRETFEQGSEMLQAPWCVGIKIHPEQHRYPIRLYGRRIFEYAEKHGAIVQSHSGQKRSMPEDFLRLANDFPGVKVIISHMGFSHDGKVWHQVRAISKSRHGNIYTDTSTMRTIYPGLLEWAVGEIGADRILFGTDSCLYHAPMYRARIDTANIPVAAKRKILRENAVGLFPALRRVSAR